MKIIEPLLKLQNQLKVFHWQTNSFAAHKALGETYDSFNTLIDDFVEIYIGKYGRQINETVINFQITFDMSNLDGFIDSSIQYLVALTSDFNENTDTDLLNIRDEMLGALNKLKYLLTLK